MSVPFPVSRSIPENDEPENVPLPPETPGETRFPDAAEVLDEAKARVESGGPNELRESLGKLISLCQHLTSRISTLEPQLSELQTTLTLTQSNLTLAMANTEMLEDALKNTNARDVGWRRSDSTSRRPVAFSVSYPSTSDAKIVVHAPSPLSPSSSPPATLKRTTSTASTPNESRFFKFRFGSKSPSPTSPAHPASPPPAHLTSASLPSLGLALEEAEKEEAEKKLKAREEELSAQIKARDEQLKAREEALKAREAELAAAKAKEKELNELLASEKRETARVSEEIESLTQSLFEEANKMVADERKKMAEVEALLRETEEERDAVRGAMKVVEGENGRLRELSAKLEVEGRKSEESWKEEESWKVVEADTSKSEVALEDSSKAGSRDEPVKDEPLKGEPVKEVGFAKSVDPAEEGPTVSVEEAGKSDEPDEPLDTPARSPSPSSPALSREGTPEPQLNGYRAIPSLPNSSSDIWKDQARDRGTTPPKTPPRVHTLPVETSPWAEGKA